MAKASARCAACSGEALQGIAGGFLKFELQFSFFVPPVVSLDRAAIGFGEGVAKSLGKGPLVGIGDVATERFKSHLINLTIISYTSKLNIHLGVLGFKGFKGF